MRMQTPLMLHPAQHPQQRSGGIDPTDVLRACQSIPDKTPELLEVCRQAQVSGGNWWSAIGNIPIGKIFFPALSAISTGFILRNNITTFVANQTAKNKAAQKAVQENLNRFDLKLLEKVTEFEAPKTLLHL